MNAVTRKTVACAGSAAALCAPALWFFISPRLSALLVLGLLLVALASYALHRNKRVVLGIWAVLVIVSALPVDIAFRRGPAQPFTVVPVMYGFPSDDSEILIGQGRAWPAGCIVFPFAPRWVIVL
jgi:hypothetical protein